MAGPTADDDDEFADEHTPLPTIPGVRHDPEFPTGKIPRIELDQLDDDDAASLYPRWSVASACADAAELAELFAPHFEGTRLWLFPASAPPSETRVAIEVTTRDGVRALAGIADVLECTERGPYERLAIRVGFLSIDRSSSPCVLQMTASGEAMRALFESSDSGGTKRPSHPALRDDRTTRMSRIELADLMGASLDELHGWDARLACVVNALSPAEPEHEEEEEDDDDVRPTQPITPPPPRSLPLEAPPLTELVPRMSLRPAGPRVPRWVVFGLVAIAALGGAALLYLITS